MKPRPYQQDAIKAVFDRWRENDSITGLAATGAGKTNILLWVLEEALKNGGRGMIVAHRRFLVSQPMNRIKDHYPLLSDVGAVQGENAQHDKQLICATIQTLASPGRLDAVLAYGKIDYLVIDECHRAVAPQYIQLIERLREQNPSLKILGVTATAERTDGTALSQVFHPEPSFRITMQSLIKQGFLSPFSGLAIGVPASLESVKIIKRSGDNDYKADELTAVMDVDNVRQIVFLSWLEYAYNRPTVFFTSGVDESVNLANYFNEMAECIRKGNDIVECLEFDKSKIDEGRANRIKNGVKWLKSKLDDGMILCGHIDGTTGKKERNRVLDGYKNGDIHIVTNCFVLVEGWDAPRTSCIGMLRPTQSSLVYTQAVGRGLRPYRGKSDCMILDFVPDRAVDLMMAHDLLGRPKAERKAERKAQEAGVVLDAFFTDEDGVGIDAEPDEIIVRALNLMAESPYAWLHHDGTTSLGLGTRNQKPHALLISNEPTDNVQSRIEKGIAMDLSEKHQRQLDMMMEWVVTKKWAVWYCWQGMKKPIIIGLADDMADAQEIAESFADEMKEKGHTNYAGKKKRWRKESPSTGQKNLLEKFKVDTEGLTKGQASQLITHYISLKSI